MNHLYLSQTLLINLASFCLPLDPAKSIGSTNLVEPIGCFTEKAKKGLLPVVYHKITGRVNKKCSGILTAYEECKQKAAELKPLEIFGISNMKKCVTTVTGKFDEYFSKAPDSRGCKTCQGKGIGSKKNAVFVYRK